MCRVSESLGYILHCIMCVGCQKVLCTLLHGVIFIFCCIVSCVYGVTKVLCLLLRGIISIFSHHIYLLTSCLSFHVVSHIMSIFSHDVYLLRLYLSSYILSFFLYLSSHIISISSHHVYHLQSCLYKRDYILQKRPVISRSQIIEPPHMM